MTVSYLLYCNDYGHYGKKFWHQVISEKEKITRKKLDKNIEKNINDINNKSNLIKALSQNIQKLWEKFIKKYTIKIKKISFLIKKLFINKIFYL